MTDHEQQIADLTRERDALRAITDQDHKNLEALRAEVDQLRAINDNCNEVLERQMEQNEELRAEVERLAKRNAALEEAFKIGKTIDEYHMDRMVEIAELRAYIHEIGKMVGVENWNGSPTDMVVQSAVSMMAHEEKELRARLAAAERVCEAARGCLYGESLSLFPTFEQQQELINSLAAYDAAKESNTP